MSVGVRHDDTVTHPGPTGVQKVASGLSTHQTISSLDPFCTPPILLFTSFVLCSVVLVRSSSTAVTLVTRQNVTETGEVSEGVDEKLVLIIIDLMEI